MRSAGVTGEGEVNLHALEILYQNYKDSYSVVEPIWYIWILYSDIALSSVTLKIVCCVLYNENSTGVFNIVYSTVTVYHDE